MEDDPVWAGLQPCAPSADARRWHALAGVFLLALLLRCAGSGFTSVLSACALGGGLWWVAQRQAGAQAAALALALLAGSPRLLQPGREVLASAALFAMVYTVLGVAHASQGPRRKWLPRTVLMTAVMAVLAFVSPWACALGLPLALVGAWYVVRGRRRVLLFLGVVWWALTVVSTRVSSAGTTTAMPEYGGLLLSFSCALGLWAVSRRSRWFGNTLPLWVAAALFGPAHSVGPGAIVWCLPFALLFIAGVTSDALQRGFKHRWAAVFWTLAALQFIFSFV